MGAAVGAIALRASTGRKASQGAKTTKEGQFIPVSGPTMVRRGVGEPDVKSWSRPYSTALGLLKLETHTSPKGSTATPYGPHNEPAAPTPVELIVTAGAGEPDLKSCALVNSTSSLLHGVP